ncbi:hypothetical protein V5799_005092 [Amblyomma americanum]|uniref:TWiK family of potassium channels protein 7 n=1 Tax=Amblyomma americanum TaxID=6943 RepID=A0AAQ4E091_AMBAM
MERKRSSRRHHHHHGAAAAVAPPENRCKSCCRKFTAFLFSHVGLCALVVGYSILGAFAFRALEAPYEVEKASQVIAMRRDTVARLWEITDRLNVLYKENWTAAVSHEILDFQARLIAAVKDGYDGKEIGAGGQQWSFSGAFLYSLTVITTIGESDSAGAKARCMLSRLGERGFAQIDGSIPIRISNFRREQRGDKGLDIIKIHVSTTRASSTIHPQSRVVRRPPVIVFHKRLLPK